MDLEALTGIVMWAGILIYCPGWFSVAIVAIALVAVVNRSGNEKK